MNPMLICCRAHASTERGPRAVPRPGSEYAAPLCERGALRCSFREGSCGTAVAALNAPQLHGSSPVRPLRGPTAPLSTALLAGPYSPRRGTALAPMRRSGCSTTNAAVVSAKPWSGVRRQRHEAALRSAGPRWARAPARASCSDSPRLFERSERSERSEFRGATSDRAPQGSRPAGQTAASERWRTPDRGFASLGQAPVAKRAQRATEPLQ